MRRSKDGEEEITGVVHAQRSTIKKCIRRLEKELRKQKRYWIEKEIDLLKTRKRIACLTTAKCDTDSLLCGISIKNVGELLNDYSESSKDLKRWKEQALLKTTYKLDGQNLDQDRS